MGLAKNGIGSICFSFFLFSALIQSSAAATESFSSAPDGICAPPLTDTSPDNLKIFDSHVHVSSDYTSDLVISEMDAGGVSMANLYPDNENTGLDYIARYPSRFFTFAGFPGNGSWVNKGQRFIDHLKSQLSTGRFKGLGEIDLRLTDKTFNYSLPPEIYVPPDSAAMLQVVDLSASYNVPISFHFVPDDPAANAALERMFSYNKKAILIWCHLGFNEMPLNASTLNSYLLRYPNLYLDTAGVQNMMGEPGEVSSNWRGALVNQSDGHLNAEWKEFFETWNSRILWGSDAGGGEGEVRWLNYANNTVKDFPPDAVGRWRSALANLDSNSARNIFVANAEAIILKKARPAYNYSVASNGQCFPISIRSNSSVSSLVFDQATGTIAFKTADSSETAGSAVVSIPTGLLNGAFRVQVNGQNVQFGEASSLAHTDISIGYGGGINTIAIKATAPVNQTPSLNQTSQNQSSTPQPAATTKDDAQSALSAAQAAISDANTAGKDITAANKKFADANAAFGAGNYSQAKELADDAETLALGAPSVVAANQSIPVAPNNQASHEPGNATTATGGQSNAGIDQNGQQANLPCMPAFIFAFLIFAAIIIRG